MRIFIASILLIVSASCMSFGQSKNYDSRLTSGFSEDEIKNMDVETLAFHTYCIEHAFFIAEAPNDKKSEVANFKSIEIKNIDNINFFDLQIDVTDNNQYFFISNSNKILTVKPKSEILKELE